MEILKRAAARALVLGLLAAGAATASAQELMGEYWNWTTQPANSARPQGAPAKTVNASRIDFSDDPADVAPVVQWNTFLAPEVNSGTGNPPDNFYALYTGFIRGPITGTVTFHCLADDGVELQVNGTVVAVDWTTHAPRDATGTINLQQDIWYPIRLAFFEGGVTSRLRLDWSYQGQARTVVPSTHMAVTVPPPPAPVIVSSQAGDLMSTFNNFQWTYSGSGTAFNIYANGSSTPLATVPITTLTYTDNAANAYGVTTCYTVHAVNGVQGPASNQVCLTPQPPPPRTNDHEEGLFEDRCACGSSIPAGGLFAWAALALAAALALGRR